MYSGYVDAYTVEFDESTNRVHNIYRILCLVGLVFRRTECEFKLHSFRDNLVFFNLDEFQIVLVKTRLELIERQENYNVWVLTVIIKEWTEHYRLGLCVVM